MQNSHTQEVCSLSWSYDGRHLASGGNDNLVNVWNMNQVVSNLDPLQTFTDHCAAIKVCFNFCIILKRRLDGIQEKLIY